MSLGTYLNECKLESDSMSKQSIKELLANAKNGDKEARDKVIINNIGLVMYRVNGRFSNSDSDKEDLLSVGIFGLIKAIDTYDLSRGVNFSTYALRCIDNEIICTLRKKNVKTESLEDIFYESFRELKSDVDIQEDYEKKELYQIIDALVCELSMIERKVIELYFGFYDDIEVTQKEIAERLSISQSAVSRIIKRGLEKLEIKLRDLDLIHSIRKEYDYRRVAIRHQVRSNSIYDFFSEYSKEQVDAMLATLTPAEQKLVELRYDKSEGKNVFERLKGHDAYSFYYNTLLPAMQKRLSDLATLHESNDVQENGKFNYFDVEVLGQNLPNQELVNIVLEKYTRVEAVIVALKFGYYDGNHYSAKEIASMLNLNLNEVYECLKNALILYRTYLDNKSQQSESMTI